MRLLFVVPSLRNTGPVNVALNLCKGINSLSPDIKIDLISFSGGEQENEFKLFCERVIILNFVSAIVFLQYNRYYDVIHSHCLLPDLLNAFFTRKSKKFSTLHNYIDVDYNYEYGNLKGKLISFLHKIALRRIGKVVSCSKSVSDHVRFNYRLCTDFVRNGVLESDKKNKCNNNAINFLMVGVFNKRKNHEVAINAFINAKIYNSNLTIIGDGPLWGEMRDKYSLQENINFIGKVNNPRDYMCQCDVFLSSSLAEGLPMAMIESMSESLGYIVSDIPPHREIYEICPFSGVLVENNIHGFQRAIEDIDIVKIKEMKLHAISVFLSNFTAKHMSSEYIKLYQGHI
ncbi:glycosyltransferase family 4 protein [Vibrio cholerae]|uniref:glycosyltransferase family 4 protein n=1 Tax=Vibrio cholerae TaxID=666 RepID=UPI00396779CC